MQTPVGQKTTLDYVAEGYWQDFLAKRPIAGGMAYEVEVRYCRLDDTLDSLQRVDTLLSKIRRDIIQSRRLEASILADDTYRQLLLFLAFYSGRVLQAQSALVGHWFSPFDLKSRNANLVLNHDDFYQQLAFGIDGALFFALEPMGLRLFGSIDRPFQAVQNQPIASGLYQGVLNVLNQLGIQSLPDDVSLAKNEISLLKTNQLNPSQFKNDVERNNNSRLNESLIQPQQVVTNNSAVNNLIPKALPTENLEKTNLIKNKAETKINQNLPKTLPVAQNIAQKPSATIDQSIPQSLPNQIPISKPTKPKPAKAIAPTPEVFVQLMSDIDNIEVAQTGGVSDYQKARKILDQFERHIAKQKKPRSEVTFSEANLSARNKALALLEQSAKDGNTAAMLYLAMYELLGEGLIKDSEARVESALETIKKAAATDSRAQRLLSRLYYQGLFVPQDLAVGKFWLEKAAENGHPEALSVQSQWQQAELLLTSQKQEQTSIQRYQIFITVLVVAAILLVIFL